MRPLRLLLPAALLVAAAALADGGRDDAAAAAREAAMELQPGVRQAADMDPAAMVPGYSNQVPQTELYGAGDALVPLANSARDGNEAAAAVDASAAQRQRIVLDRDNDPMLVRGRAVADDAGRIVGIGEGSDSGCVTIPAATSGSTTVERCTSWNASERGCERNCYCQHLVPAIRMLRGSGDVAVDYSLPQLQIASGSGNGDWDGAWGGSGCGQHDATVTFMLDDPDLVAEFTLLHAQWRDHIRLELNGRQIFIGPHAGDSLQLDVSVEEGYEYHATRHCSISLGPVYGCLPDSPANTCCRITRHPVLVRRTHYYADYGIQKKACAAGSAQRQPNLDLRPWLVPGLNTLGIRVISAAAGGVRLRFALRTRCSCGSEGSIDDGGCAQLERYSGDGSCQLRQHQCLDGDALCSRQRRSYICLGSTLHEEPYCAQLRQRGCVWAASQCVDADPQGNCIEYEQSYECGGTVPAQPQMEDCSARISCLGDDCNATGYSPSADFAATASHLSAMQQAGQDFDADSLSIFAGSAHRCKKTILGFANCCRDSGWGVSLGLSRCGDSERMLGEKRQAGQCHYVGSYKRGSLFSKKRYQSFCCFSSKLGRVVQQQGRAQLGLHWGPATAPDCRGFSTEELGSLDFESFDMGEIEADMLRQAEQAGNPDAGALSERLRRQLDAMAQ